MASTIKSGQLNMKSSGLDQKSQRNASIAPAISYTPTDTSIPPSLYNKIPSLENYKKLTETEKKIDLLYTRKALDLQAVNMKLAQESAARRDFGTLRVFIYNICENQPWQVEIMKEKGIPIQNANEEASYTLKVEGRFINPSSREEKSPQKLKFSSFLSGLSIDLIPNDDYPELLNTNNNIVEWQAEASGQRSENTYNHQSEFDGLDIKRNGIFNLNAKIAILIKESSGKFRLSDIMAHFVGREEATQQEVMYQIWQYAIYKNLMKNDTTKVPAISNSEAAIMNGTDTSNIPISKEDDFTFVESDTVLREILQVQHFKFADLYKLVQPHFLPRSPIIIDYEINTRKSTTLGEVVIDIPIELPYSASNVQKEIMEDTKAIYEKQAKVDAVIQQLNNKIALGIVALQNLNSRELFYRELSEDPVGFMKKWLEGQSESLKALKSDEGYNEEIVRKVDYFEKNEDMLRDKIDILLGSGRV